LFSYPSTFAGDRLAATYCPNLALHYERSVAKDGDSG
jgi:hypothetical protein